MSRSTRRIPATEVRIGDTLAWPDGSTLTVESVTRDGCLIDFAGTRIVYSAFGNQAHPGGVGRVLVDDFVAVAG